MHQTDGTHYRRAQRIISQLRPSFSQLKGRTWRRFCAAFTQKGHSIIDKIIIIKKTGRSSGALISRRGVLCGGSRTASVLFFYIKADRFSNICSFQRRDNNPKKGERDKSWGLTDGDKLLQVFRPKNKNLHLKKKKKKSIIWNPNTMTESLFSLY